MITVARAHTTGGEFDPPRSGRIDITTDIPMWDGTLATNLYREFYEKQGKLIENELFESLPGGTYDALLRHMLERRASLLRVRFK